MTDGRKSWGELGLTAAVADLEQLRRRLEADELRAEWDMSRGHVVIVVPGPRMYVDGDPVPMTGGG